MSRFFPGLEPRAVVNVEGVMQHENHDAGRLRHSFGREERGGSCMSRYLESLGDLAEIPATLTVNSPKRRIARELA